MNRLCIVVLVIGNILVCSCGTNTTNSTNTHQDSLTLELCNVNLTKVEKRLDRFDDIDCLYDETDALMTFDRLRPNSHLVESWYYEIADSGYTPGSTPDYIDVIPYGNSLYVNSLGRIKFLNTSDEVDGFFNIENGEYTNTLTDSMDTHTLFLYDRGVWDVSRVDPILVDSNGVTNLNLPIVETADTKYWLIGSQIIFEGPSGHELTSVDICNKKTNWYLEQIDKERCRSSITECDDSSTQWRFTKTTACVRHRYPDSEKNQFGYYWFDLENPSLLRTKNQPMERDISWEWFSTDSHYVFLDSAGSIDIYNDTLEYISTINLSEIDGLESISNYHISDYISIQDVIVLLLSRGSNSVIIGINTNSPQDSKIIDTFDKPTHLLDFWHNPIEILSIPDSDKDTPVYIKKINNELIIHNYPIVYSCNTTNGHRNWEINVSELGYLAEVLWCDWRGVLVMSDTKLACFVADEN